MWWTLAEKILDTFGNIAAFEALIPCLVNWEFPTAPVCDIVVDSPAGHQDATEDSGSSAEPTSRSSDGHSRGHTEPDSKDPKMGRTVDSTVFFIGRFMDGPLVMQRQVPTTEWQV